MVRVVRFLTFLSVALLIVACRPSPGDVTRPSGDSAERQRLISELLGRVPAGASLSIQSNLLTYLGPKGSPYLFPVVADAEYVLADVAASPDPVVGRGLQRKVRELLDSAAFGLVDAADGLALLRRGLPGQTSLPPRFYDFLRAKSGDTAFASRVRFGEDFELVGYDYETKEGRLTRLATYWRALRPLDLDHRLVFFLTPAGGGQPDAAEDSSLESLWYPPSRWQSGEVIKVDLPAQVIARDTSIVQVVAYQQGPQGRVALTPRLADGKSSESAPTVLDLTRPPSEKVSLGDYIGLPYESDIPASRMVAVAIAPGLAPADAAPLEERSLCGRNPASSLRPVAIKIDNAAAARPQSGLDRACIVYEHVTEAGITRFTAIYQDEDTEVGPVRSARRVDLQILPQYQAIFGHVGGAPAEMDAIRSSDILDVDQFFHSEAYYKPRQRVAPHNVFTSVSAIRATGERLGYEREAELEGFLFARTGLEGGSPADDIVLPYRSGSEAEFRYDPDAGDYVRYTGGLLHVDVSTGNTVRATTIVVQHVPSWVVSTTEDAGGAASYDFDLVGEGAATVFRDGQAIEGRWVRPELESWTDFYDDNDNLIPLAPGKVWISLVAPNDRITIR